MTTSLLRQFFFYFSQSCGLHLIILGKRMVNSQGGGGHLGIFGWVCAAGDSKLAPRSKKKTLKLVKWANFLNPVLEFAPKLIPRSRNGPVFILRSRVQQEYNSLLVNALNRILKSNLSLSNFKCPLTKLELSRIRNIIPHSRKRL